MFCKIFCNDLIEQNQIYKTLLGLKNEHILKLELEKEPFCETMLNNNLKYKKIVRYYQGRTLPKGTKLQIDVRTFFTPYDDVLQQHLTKESDDKTAVACQQWVIKNIKYTPDRTLYKTNEYWAFPFETMKTLRGDCDDGSILMANLMLAAGIPYYKIRIVAGDTPIGGHAYVVYYSEEINNWVTMDWCYYPNLKPIKERSNYKQSNLYGKIWFSFNMKYTFVRR